MLELHCRAHLKPWLLTWPEAAPAPASVSVSGRQSPAAVQMLCVDAHSAAG